MPEEWRVSLPESEPQRSRHIADFIAGMTDRFAITQCARIYGSMPEGLSNV
jgi:dGTPase